MMTHITYIHNFTRLGDKELVSLTFISHFKISTIKHANEGMLGYLTFNTHCTEQT